MSKHKSSQILGAVFRAQCIAFDTPKSLGMWLRYKYGLYDELVTASVDPLDYNDPLQYNLDYAIVEYLSKNEVLPTTYDRRAEALRRFNASEEACRVTNYRFQAASREIRANTAIISIAVRKIADILGPCNIGTMMLGCRWGPGSTFDIPKSRATKDRKFSVMPSVTREAVPYLLAYIEQSPMWFYSITGIKPEGDFCALSSLCKIVGGNKVVTVPKNAKTDRTIAQEPTANSFLQQGVGRYIRSRLKRFGVDLDNQKINQTWASKAYDLDLCTVDLSQASDTIAKELVFSLLPLDWALLLDNLRSKFYFDVDSKSWKKYEKFSSMGNAFTFELESLIFYALIWACVEVVDPDSEWGISAYGDDIICPQSVYPEVKQTLADCGFSLNEKKTHSSGVFFESCGEHFFEDKNVTPIYQKAKLSGAEYVRAHNRLHRFRLNCASKYEHLLGRGPALLLRREAPQPYRRTYLPDTELADDGFLYERDEFPGRKTSRNYGWRCTTYREARPVRADALSLGRLASNLLDSEVRPALVGRQLPEVTVAFGDGKNEVGPIRVTQSKRWVFPDSILWCVSS